jgi:serine/threonine protein kinase
MSDHHPAATGDDRERLLAELARREGDDGETVAATAGIDDATVHELRDRLETLADRVRQPPPLDSFAEESDCQRATEWVERMANSAPFSNDDSTDDTNPDGRVSPERIGPYAIIGPLGRGGMGTVLKAVHTKLRRQVAIKVLPTARTTNRESVARFEREMAAIGGLHHPHIVTAHDAGEVDGMQYLVMEYVDGVDLSTLVRRVGPLPPATACEIVRQAALGLEEAHQAGIIHRDVKPSNIMLSEPTGVECEPTVKLLDFGLALLAPRHGGDAELTSTGQIMGTLNYMAPEQCSESHAVDQRADVYSLGATLYRLLSGKAPFDEERFTSPMALIPALANQRPTRLDELRDDLPPRLVAVVERMMATDPADRFANMGEVIAALAEWSDGRDLSSVLQAALIETDDTEPPERVSRRVAIAPRAVRRQRRQSRFGVALGCMAVVALVSLAVAWWLSDRPTAEHFSAEQQSRRVAEWLSSQQANYGVSVSNKGYVEVQPGSAPPSGEILLNTVSLAGNEAIKDDDLARFDNLPTFATFVLTATKVGDAGLGQLGRLPDLDHLFLSGTQVTDAGLDKLRRFRWLKTLHLNNTGVTDAGLDVLAEFTSLEELELFGCRISDDGLTQLHKLSQLKRLQLTHTFVTPRGIALLQRALPECKIKTSFSDEEIANAADEI